TRGLARGGRSRVVWGSFGGRLGSFGGSTVALSGFSVLRTPITQRWSALGRDLGQALGRGLGASSGLGSGASSGLGSGSGRFRGSYCLLLGSRYEIGLGLPASR